MERLQKTLAIVFQDGTKSTDIKSIIQPVLVGDLPLIKAKRFTGDSLPDADVIVGMGIDVLKLVQDTGHAPRNKGIAALSGVPIKLPSGATFLTTYTPSFIDKMPHVESDIQWAVRLGIRIAMTGTAEPTTGEYRYVENLDDCIDYIKNNFTGKKIPIAFDLETMGLDPFASDKQIVSASVTYQDGQADVVYFNQAEPYSEAVVEQLQWLLTTNTVQTWGANLAFDMMWLREEMDIEVTNFVADTVLVGSLLNENRSNSLGLHAKLFTTMGGYDATFNQSYDKGHMEDIPRDALLEYAGGDTDATMRVARVLLPQLAKNPKLLKLYKTILHPAQLAFVNMERRGIPIDESKFDELSLKLTSSAAHAEKECIKMLPARIRNKYVDNLKLTRALILRDYFFSPLGLNLKPDPNYLTEKTGLPSTKKEHLETFAANPKAKDFVAMLTEMNQSNKTRSTFVEGFLKHKRSTGRFHPSYLLFAGEGRFDKQKRGTVTGRLSAQGPAIQTLPKHTKWAKALRGCYVAPEGYKFYQLDFSEGELRIIACFSKDPVMVDAYSNGISIHAVTAAARVGVSVEEFMTWKTDRPEEFAEARSGAKANNFGLVYGMGAKGFVNYCWSTWGKALTLREAQDEINLFFNLYTKLRPWHSNMEALCKKKGEISSPTGRTRHLPNINSNTFSLSSAAQRQAINSPVQSLLSDAMLWSIALIDQEFGDKAGLVATIHDSVIGLAKEEDIPEVVPRIAEIMTTLPFEKEFGWSPVVPFAADAEVGDSLADLKEIDIDSI